MVKLIINGASGAMGRTIAQCAAARSDEFQVVAGIAKHFPDGFSAEFPLFYSQSECDVPADIVIDFSLPEALPGVIELAKRLKAGLVIGTTGLCDADYERIHEAGKDIPVFLASNMSLGVNLQIDLVKRAASFLGDRFEVEIVERHHNNKVDAPSGTAITLAKAIAEQYPDGRELVFERHSVRKKRDRREIGMHAVRGGSIVGDHDVMFIGDDEILEIIHSARSKKVFAQGALRAAQFIRGKEPRVYSMGEIFADLNALTDVYAATGQSAVTLSGVDPSPHLVAEIFGAIAAAGVNIDMISQSEPKQGRADISFTLPDESLSATLDALAPWKAHLSHTSGLAKLSVEGFGMEHRPGIAAQMFRVLADANVPVRLVTTSETKISYCIDQKDLDAAIEATQKAFGV
ncbi:MAG: 4-hydroxy-tetrahydrodipicolinate reductase [Christensenellales bacterium]|jgi:4-hydroxy-tetrahydrodipicolinate reductase